MKQKLEKLIQNCVQYFEQHSYSVPRIDRYKSMWRLKLIPYMAKRSLRCYDASVGRRFIRSEVPRGIITPYKRDIIRSITVLDEFQEKGIISNGRKKSPKKELPGSLGDAMESFLLHLGSLRRSKTTIEGHRMYMFRLLTYLESNQVQNLEKIKEEHIINFLSTTSNNKIYVISSIRL